MKRLLLTTFLLAIFLSPSISQAMLCDCDCACPSEIEMTFDSSCVVSLVGVLQRDISKARYYPIASEFSYGVVSWNIVIDLGVIRLPAFDNPPLTTVRTYIRYSRLILYS